MRAIFRCRASGTVAGCYVTRGEIFAQQPRSRGARRNRGLRGQHRLLKRFRDDVRSVREGFECGIGIENFNDVKEGDVLESFEVVEVPR